MKKIVCGLLLLIIGSLCNSWAATSLPVMQEQAIDSAVLGEKAQHGDLPARWLSK